MCTKSQGHGHVGVNRGPTLPDVAFFTFARLYFFIIIPRWPVYCLLFFSLPISLLALGHIPYSAIHRDPPSLPCVITRGKSPLVFSPFRSTYLVELAIWRVGWSLLERKGLTNVTPLVHGFQEIGKALVSINERRPLKRQCLLWLVIVVSIFLFGMVLSSGTVSNVLNASRH
ncbi:hypothetical protein K449DRAFT_43174 [Hypoxylon sp. EC38]|nr:hypothetical protein K449DRAFT_43174 [Hypoxylon sp. EC38]